MSKTLIEWTDVTWNPIRGCTRVSPGCEHCYAERMAARALPGLSSPTTGEPFARMTPAGPRWTGKVEIVESKLLEPLHWRKPRRVFVNSMSDLFHEAVPDAWIDQIFAVMALCPQHTFQVLTKRAERMQAYFAPGQFRDVKVADAAKILHTIPRPFALPPETIFDARRVALNQPWQINAWPLCSVWLGVSCEDQPRADERIPLLLQTPAAVHFVSLEPLLGPIDLTRLPMSRFVAPGEVLHGVDGLVIHALKGVPGFTPALDWLILGGESGPGARPLDVAWIRLLLQQAKAAGVAVFCKQLGAKPEQAQGCGDCARCIAGQRCDLSYNVALTLRDPKGGDPEEWPRDLRVRERLEGAK